MNRTRSIVYFNSGAIGEFLMTLYFADRVREIGAQVYVPVRRNGQQLAEFASAYPHVNVIDLGTASLLRGIRELAAISGPRTVITQQTFGRHPFLLMLLALLVARMAGNSSLLAYDDGGVVARLADDRWIFDIDAMFPDEMCKLAKRLGYVGDCGTPALTLPQGVATEASLPQHMVFHLRAYTLTRTPSMAQWRSFVRATREAYPELRFVFTGTDTDASYIQSVIDGIAGCEVRTDACSLVEVAGLIKRACAYVGPDTGITHLAAFLGTPAVVIGTRSTPCWWATYSPSVTWLTAPAHCLCTGVKSDACRVMAEGEPRFRCMVEVSVENYLSALGTAMGYAP